MIVWYNMCLGRAWKRKSLILPNISWWKLCIHNWYNYNQWESYQRFSLQLNISTINLQFTVRRSVRPVFWPAMSVHPSVRPFVHYVFILTLKKLSIIILWCGCKVFVGSSKRKWKSLSPWTFITLGSVSRGTRATRTCSGPGFYLVDLDPDCSTKTESKKGLLLKRWQIGVLRCYFERKHLYCSVLHLYCSTIPQPHFSGVEFGSIVKAQTRLLLCINFWQNILAPGRPPLVVRNALLYSIMTH